MVNSLTCEVEISICLLQVKAEAVSFGHWLQSSSTNGTFRRQATYVLYFCALFSVKIENGLIIQAHKAYVQ